VAKVISDDCQGLLAIEAVKDGARAEYSVNLATPASQLDLRMKVLQAGSIDVEIDNNLVQTISIDVSMVNNDWRTIKTVLDIPTGEHILALDFKSTESGSLFQLNWLETSIYTGLEKPATRNDIPVRSFPNPCMHELNISSANELEQIWIIDDTGRIIMEEKTNGNHCVLQTGSLSRGLYIVRIQHSKGVHYLKIIKS